jgi:hypothetical protein
VELVDYDEQKKKPAQGRLYYSLRIRMQSTGFVGEILCLTFFDERDLFINIVNSDEDTHFVSGVGITPSIQ